MIEELQRAAARAVSTHPLVLLGERFGRGGALTLLLVVGIAPVVLTPEGAVLGDVGLLVAVVIGATGYGGLIEATGESEVEATQRLYAEGEITLDELNRRLDLLLDDEADRIRQAVEEVRGVGPETSAAIAYDFGTLQAVRMSTPERLQEVHGVGPSTAEAIAEHLGSGDGDTLDEKLRSGGFVPLDGGEA
jgi:ribosomal protein S13